ncbi:MAG: DnaB-like helicase N-terminal domain-containing protein [Beijerinckiaceae bacterium]|jgi:replicative DNA helicase
MSEVISIRSIAFIDVSPIAWAKHAEQAMLGYLLLTGRYGFGRLGDGMIEPNDFYWPAHGRLFKSMVDLLPAETVKVVPWHDEIVKSSSNPDAAREYIRELLLEACTGIAIKELAEMIREAAIERSLVKEVA